jgi:hypothetical protein
MSAPAGRHAELEDLALRRALWLRLWARLLGPEEPTGGDATTVEVVAAEQEERDAGARLPR